MSGDEIEGEEMELVLNEIQAKTESFVCLIKEIRVKATQQDADKSMEEI